MELKDVLPRELIKARVGPFREEVGSADAHHFVRGDKQAMSVVGLYVWDQMVARGKAPDPTAMSKVYPDRIDMMYQFLKRELQAEPITDAFTTKLFSPIRPEYSFVDLKICQCWPGDIHIEDLELSDPTRPLASPTRGHGARSFHGLHLFDAVLENIKEFARERDLDRVSLMAAFPQAHEVFSRHGFVVGDGAMARWTFDNVGMSHPMLFWI